MRQNQHAHFNSVAPRLFVNDSYQRLIMISDWSDCSWMEWQSWMTSSKPSRLSDWFSTPSMCSQKYPSQSTLTFRPFTFTDFVLAAVPYCSKAGFTTSASRFGFSMYPSICPTLLALASRLISSLAESISLRLCVLTFDTRWDILTPKINRVVLLHPAYPQSSAHWRTRTAITHYHGWLTQTGALVINSYIGLETMCTQMNQNWGIVYLN